MKKIVLLLYSITAYAAPEGFELISGQASAPQIDLQGQIHVQSTKDSIVHWNSFSLTPQETFIFDQAQETSCILNRVVGNTPSEILGKLQSNGVVYLINQNGILIGPNGVIETAGFLASTLDVLTQDFFTKNTLEFFSQNPGSIINLGTIACPVGQITLLAHHIENQGELNGSVQAVACAKAILQMDNQRVFIQTSQKLDTPENLQSLNASLYKNPYAHAIKHSGRIKSNTLGMQNGRVLLFAQEGITEVTGSIEAKEITLLGKDVLLKEQSLIDASSAIQGGKIVIGGGYKGQDPNIPLAEHVLIDKHVQIHADALQTGDGGEIIVWSKENTEFFGSLSAKGGAEVGNGGFAEVSGKKGLSFEGKVDLRAANGETGNLLIDPDIINIVPGGVDSATGQIFGTPGTANISGANVGSAINLANLTMQANFDIKIEDSIMATTAGNGLTLQAGGSIQAIGPYIIGLNGGNFSATFNDSGSSASTMNGSFAASNLTINTQGGDITIEQGNLMNTFAGTISINSSAFDSGSGSIQLTLNPNNGPTVLTGISINATTFNAGGNIILTGTAENGVIIDNSQFFSDGLISITGSGSLIAGILIDNQSTVSGDSINLTATKGSIVLEDSVIDSETSITVQTPNDLILQANTSLTALQPENGIANITVGGNLELTSGDSVQADAVIGGATSVAGGSLQFTVGENVYLISNDAQSYALIGYGNTLDPSDVTGDIIFNHVGGNVFLQGANNGTGVDGFAQIGHLGGGVSNVLNGNISLLVDGSISLMGGSASNDSYAQIGHGGFEPFITTGELAAIAGKNIILQSSVAPANIINEGGNVTLVTDNLFASTPSIGPGFFSMNSNSTLSASGQMRIYTAIRSQNQINGLINGAPFIPGALFVNTNEEMWATYYSGGAYGGGPFTIYYKDGALEAIEDIYLFAVANSEFNAEYSDILPVVNPPIYQANLDYFSQRELIWFDPYRRVLRYRLNARNLTQ